ncbi:Metallo-hydrolase/oxidoreductase [Nemania sp. FL0916]|nr:Metallo-hydrolase/oxidoreductase [Nemania sp. FL0916]
MAQYSASLSALENDDPERDGVLNKAHHVMGKDGKTVGFRNPYPSAGAWQDISFAGARLRGKLTTPQPSGDEIPRVDPDPPMRLRHRTTPSSLNVTWLGHACCLVEFPSGLRALFDPVFQDRCGPAPWLGPKRYTPPACDIHDLPSVDAVLISHSHFDHLSCRDVNTLASQFPRAKFFVGLGLASWFKANGIEAVTEMDWWDSVTLTLVRDEAQEGPEGGKISDVDAPPRIEARISCLPSQHASGRSAWDKDQTLWASWAVQSGPKSVWFGGDTGYRAVPEDNAKSETDSQDLPSCPVFEQIGRLRGPFDVGLIPIGAYKPRYLFSSWHADPYDAVNIYRDTQCTRAIGIHWGTWVLTSEPVDEPPKLLREALKKAGIKEAGVFDTVAIGESRSF